MTDASSRSNPGTKLLGEQYQRHNQIAATADRTRPGRWIAIDESGWDGDKLHGEKQHRYMTLGSVAIDDAEAAHIVADLRSRARIQAPELKFQGSFSEANRSGRRALLAELLSPGGALAGRATVYIIDKHYAVAGKLIDLLIEEHAHARGMDIYSSGKHRQLARDLFSEGHRALGRDAFDRLLGTTVAFASYSNRHHDKVSVDDFFEVVEASWTRSHRRKVTTVLELLRRTRAEAEEFAEDRRAGHLGDTLEPLLSCVPAAVSNLSERHGLVNILTDDQRFLTDAKFDLIGGALRKAPLFRSTKLGELVRGRSTEHPSLQLADLVAGAGFAVAKRHNGEHSPAGEDLYPCIVPIIDPQGMLSHDEPNRLATIDPLQAPTT